MEFTVIPLIVKNCGTLRIGSLTAGDPFPKGRPDQPGIAQGIHPIRNAPSNRVTTTLARSVV